MIFQTKAVPRLLSKTYTNLPHTVDAAIICELFEIRKLNSRKTRYFESCNIGTVVMQT